MPKHARSPDGAPDLYVVDAATTIKGRQLFMEIWHVRKNSVVRAITDIGNIVNCAYIFFFL